MATKAAIVAGIKARVAQIPGVSYGAWRIGLTHDLADRKKFWAETEKKNIGCWTSWEADSLGEAQDIEAGFINAGMVGGTGGDLSPRKTVYVYIF